MIDVIIICGFILNVFLNILWVIWFCFSKHKLKIKKDYLDDISISKAVQFSFVPVLNLVILITFISATFLYFKNSKKEKIQFKRIEHLDNTYLTDKQKEDIEATLVFLSLVRQSDISMYYGVKDVNINTLKILVQTKGLSIDLDINFSLDHQFLSSDLEMLTHDTVMRATGSSAIELNLDIIKNFSEWGMLDN